METHPTRKQNRLQDYDYSAPNAYFITVCTNDRKMLFWQDVGAIIDRPQDVKLTVVGRIVDQAIRNIPVKYPGVVLEHYVIMPNHVHLLLRICGGDLQAIGDRPYAGVTISTIMQKMKGFASKTAGFSLWQKGFYDHVVRDDQDFLDAWNYIEGNPGKWEEDRLRR